VCTVRTKEVRKIFSGLAFSSLETVVVTYAEERSQVKNVRPREKLCDVKKSVCKIQIFEK
jgi:hypothetical protein